MIRATCFHPKSLIAGLACLALALLACGLPTLFQASTPGAASESNPGGQAINPNAILLDPTSGLSGLESYHASFNQVVHGTLDGKPFDRQTTIEYSVITQTSDADYSQKIQSGDDEKSDIHNVKIGNAYYSLLNGGSDCLGTYDEQPRDSLQQPAALLLPVTEANKVGDDTVNGIATTHYKIDENSQLFEDDNSGVSGELWIAKQGGYVVRFTLDVQAPDKPTASGLQTSQAWRYELSQVNAIKEIQVPSGCIPVLADIPAMTDAQNLMRGSGAMTYVTASDATKVVDFYKQKLPAMGWQIQESQPTNQTSPFNIRFLQNDKHLEIYLDKSDSGLNVMIVLFNPAEQASAPVTSPNTTPTVEIKPTIDASQSGLPPDVPLYPGATNLKKAQSMVVFSTGDAIDVVAKFYHDQLQANGWSLTNEMNTGSNVVMQTWMKGNRSLAGMYKSENGVTTISITTSMNP
jgi:hypothetical protein